MVNKPASCIKKSLSCVWQYMWSARELGPSSPRVVTGPDMSLPGPLWGTGSEPRDVTGHVFTLPVDPYSLVKGSSIGCQI